MKSLQIIVISTCFYLAQAHMVMQHPKPRQWSESACGLRNNSKGDSGVGRWQESATEPGTQCGSCGDNPNDPPPRINEYGGKNGLAGPVAVYTEGSIISSRVVVNNPHSEKKDQLSIIEWRLCPNAKKDTMGKQPPVDKNNPAIRYEKPIPKIGGQEAVPIPDFPTTNPILGLGNACFKYVLEIIEAKVVGLKTDLPGPFISYDSKTIDVLIDYRINYTEPEKTNRIKANLTYDQGLTIDAKLKLPDGVTCAKHGCTILSYMISPARGSETFRACSEVRIIPKTMLNPPFDIIESVDSEGNCLSISTDGKNLATLVPCNNMDPAQNMIGFQPWSNYKTRANGIQQGTGLCLRLPEDANKVKENTTVKWDSCKNWVGVDTSIQKWRMVYNETFPDTSEDYDEKAEKDADMSLLEPRKFQLMASVSGFCLSYTVEVLKKVTTLTFKQVTCDSNKSEQLWILRRSPVIKIGKEE